jgi:hypothetical protein
MFSCPMMEQMNPTNLGSNRETDESDEGKRKRKERNEKAKQTQGAHGKEKQARKITGTKIETGLERGRQAKIATRNKLIVAKICGIASNVPVG